MSFYEDVWEEADGHREKLDEDIISYFPAGEPRKTKHAGYEMYEDLPTWVEEPAANDRATASRYERSDLVAISSYLLTSFILAGFAFEQILSHDKNWTFAMLFLALMCILLALGRVIEIRGRGSLA